MYRLCLAWSFITVLKKGALRAIITTLRVHVNDYFSVVANVQSNGQRGQPSSAHSPNARGDLDLPSDRAPTPHYRVGGPMGQNADWHIPSHVGDGSNVHERTCHQYDGRVPTPRLLL